MLICICITFFNFKELIIIFTLNSEVFTSTIYVRTRSRPWDAYTQPAVSTVAILILPLSCLIIYNLFLNTFLIFHFPPSISISQERASSHSASAIARSVSPVSVQT